MQLNETAAKLDQQIDIACKKYEKLCFDNGAQELIYKDDQTDKTMQYKDYIKNFEWNYRKYNIKLPLNELCSAFTKTLQMQDVLLKKHQDELNSHKTKL